MTKGEHTSSPYFPKKRRKVVVAKSRKQDQHTSSPYFKRRQPVCPFASANELGPLIVCLSGTQDPGCSRSSDDDDDEEFPCGSCSCAIARALDHFQSCKLFREMWVQSSGFAETTESARALPSCWAILQEAERRLHFSVRHLCSLNCYMRAYAPYRAWHSFRCASSPLEIASNDNESLLPEWRCHLLSPPQCQNVDDQQCGQSSLFHSATRRRLEDHPYLPRTYFSHSTGLDQCFYSEVSAVRHVESQQRSLFSTTNTGDHTATDSKGASMETTKAAKSTREMFAHRVSSTERLFRQDPVHSPYGLLEELFHDDPWKLLLCAILLNRTTRRQVDSVLYEFLQRWPNPFAVVQEQNPTLMTQVLRPLGMHRRRTSGILQFSKDYLHLVSNTHASELLEREQVLRLFQCGEYASDAYQLFIRRNLSIEPADKMLKVYKDYTSMYNKNTDD